MIVNNEGICFKSVLECHAINICLEKINATMNNKRIKAVGFANKYTDFRWKILSNGRKTLLIWMAQTHKQKTMIN